MGFFSFRQSIKILFLKKCTKLFGFIYIGSFNPLFKEEIV